MRTPQNPAAAIALALTLMCVGCSSTADMPAAPTRSWSVSFQWSNTENVDLDSPPISAIRAAAENNLIALGIGRRYTYPGYLEAAGPNATAIAVNALDNTVGPIGTLRLNLLLEQATEQRVDAIVCTHDTDVSQPTDGRFPLARNYASGALWATRVTVEKPDTPAPGWTDRIDDVDLETPLLPLMTGPEGRAPRPADNVFGDWRITHYELEYARPSYDACLPWAQQRWGGSNPPAPNRTEADPPVIEPFYPGW